MSEKEDKESDKTPEKESFKEPTHSEREKQELEKFKEMKPKVSIEGETKVPEGKTEISQTGEEKQPIQVSQKDSFEAPSLSTREEEEIKKFKEMKPKVSISEAERIQLEEAAQKVPEAALTIDEATVLDMLTRRKFLDQITREFNLALRPLGKPLKKPEAIREILTSLEEKKLIKKLIVNEKEIWVSVEHYSEKAFGTDRL